MLGDFYFLCKVIPIFRILLFLIFSLPIFAQSDYYIKLAQDKKLSKSAYWHILLHMPDEESEVRDKKFFLAPDGKTNASSELEATIYSLYNEVRFDNNSTACLFPARKHWLVEKLGMKNLPKVQCDDFDYLIKRMDPKSVSLIFPFMQGSSPSSMFGHTFLRIDSNSNPTLLSYAFNYATVLTQEEENDNRLSYMYKGFFGGYKGHYSLETYYQKIKEYRDLEERDIWEYDLNLTQEETLQMIRHMWEIELVSSRYYFFTQNCSYKMFWVMESAREGLDLHKYFNYHVIPSESIRATIDEGLVDEQHYRPARSSKLMAYEDKLSKDDIDDVFKISAQELSPEIYLEESNSGKQTKRLVLEASAEFVEYDYQKKDINESVYKGRLFDILKSRSSLGRGEVVDVPTPANPMLSHRSFRVSAEVGTRNSELIGFLGVRPANHDIKDFDMGFLDGTQIEFMDLLFSYKENLFQVEKATLISVTALTPRSDFFKQGSYRFSIGFDRNFLSENTDFSLKYSKGATWGSSVGYLYTLLDALAYMDRSAKVAIGGSIGVVLREGEIFKTNIEVSQRIYNDAKAQWIVLASQSYRPSQNTALNLSYEYVQKYQDDWNTFKLSFNYFF